MVANTTQSNGLSETTLYNESIWTAQNFTDGFPNEATTLTSVSGPQVNAVVETAFAVITLCIAVVVICGNGLVIGAVIKFRELRSVPNLFIVHLAVTDLVVGVCVLPVHAAIFVVVDLQQSFVVCALRYGLFVMTFGTSVILLVAISIDRYIAIRKPLRYQQIVTRTRARVVVYTVWIYGILSGLVPLIPGANHWQTYHLCELFHFMKYSYLMFLVVQVIVFLIVHLIIYGDIFRTAARTVKEINAATVNVHVITGSNAQSQTRVNFRKNIKAAKTVGLVVGVYALCTLPFAIFTLVGLSMFPESPQWLLDARTYTTLLMIVNSAANPFIYHRRSSDFRTAFRKMLPCVVTSRRVASSPTGNTTDTM